MTDRLVSLTASSSFEKLLQERLLPEFCGDPSRNYPLSVFRAQPSRLAEEDKRDFMRAWRANLIEHCGRGQYRASHSYAKEQFFWHVGKGDDRAITLWLEPLMTVAALARLHLDHGWPRELLGTQSKDYAFDVIAFCHAGENEMIAGEIKKTMSETRKLIDFMLEFAKNWDAPRLDLKGKELNAYRKLTALSARRIPKFWVVGPGGIDEVFLMRYDEKRRPSFVTADRSALRFDSKTLGPVENEVRGA